MANKIGENKYLQLARQIQNEQREIKCFEWFLPISETGDINLINQRELHQKFGDRFGAFFDALTGLERARAATKLAMKQIHGLSKWGHADNL
jgi:hypothetical protein